MQWQEAMAMGPHHSEAGELPWLHLIRQSEKWNLHYSWGLRAIDFDFDALAKYRLVVRSLEARMRDGTLVSVPAESALPEIDLQPVFKGGEEDKLVMVYLAVPAVQVGPPNVPAKGRTEGTRYFAEPAELKGENTGDNPQPVQICRLNLRLLLSTEDQTGYETLPIAQLKKGAKPEATPQLDDSYIPPVLACDAWKTLQERILRKIYDQVGTAGREQARLIVSRGITFSSQNLGEVRRFEQVRVLNEAYSVLNVVAMARGIHPLWAYVELCRLVGQLSIFDETTRRPAALPQYDHDDLGGCFYGVLRHIEALSPCLQSQYEEAPFVGAGWRMQVAIQQMWMLPTWEMYVGVDSPLKPEESIRMLTERGRLDVRIASAGRVDPVVQRGLRGLVFRHSPQPPRVLPSRPGVSYFQIDRASQPEEWAHVQRELTLAIRLNKDLIVGNIQDQAQLTIKVGGQTATMRFTLYIVPPEKDEVPLFEYSSVNSAGCSDSPPTPNPPPHLHDDVQFTVYRPAAIQPHKWYLLLAFAHLDELPPDVSTNEPDPIEEVMRQANQALGEKIRDYRESTHDSNAVIPHGGEITFLPEVAGIEFNPPRQSFLWQENVHREEFRLRASPRLDGQTARGTLTVFLGSILLAEIPLRFRVTSSMVPDSDAMPAQRSCARPYRKIFASYAHKDVEIVEQFERYGRTLGDTYLRDCTHLRAGEIWSQRLELMIEEADVFQLFWSWNAIRSEFVEREWTFALALRRSNFIRPTFWEVPLPALPEKGLPPKELRRLHFQCLTLDTATHQAGTELGDESPDWRSESHVEVKANRKMRYSLSWIAVVVGVLLLLAAWLLSQL